MRRIVSSHTDSASPTGTASSPPMPTSMLDSHMTPAATRDRDNPIARKAAMSAETVIYRHRQQNGDQEKTEEQSHRPQDGGDLTKIGKLHTAETLDELLVGDDIDIGMSRAYRRGGRESFGRRRRTNQQHLCTIATLPSAQPSTSISVPAMVAAVIESNGKSAMPPMMKRTGGSASPASSQRPRS